MSSCNQNCNQGRTCDCAPDCSRDDPLAAARGIVNGLLLALPFWLLVMLAWWLS